MKLLGILKEKFDKAETIEDKKKVLTEVGIELTDDELEYVAGGIVGDELTEETIRQIPPEDILKLKHRLESIKNNLDSIYS